MLSSIAHLEQSQRIFPSISASAEACATLTIRADDWGTLAASYLLGAIDSGKVCHLRNGNLDSNESIKKY
jgi:hypothetical protein